jgi:dihydrofolate reductase
MAPLRYSINVTLDGCCHHEAGLPPDEESMRYWTAQLERADALIFGRVTYGMMASAWRKPDTGTWPDWVEDWQLPFAETIHRAKKYVVSSTLSDVDWNAELVKGDVSQAVRRLKQRSSTSLWVGGVTLPTALADPARTRRPPRVPVGSGRHALPTRAGRVVTCDSRSRSRSRGTGFWRQLDVAVF